jgi:Leucine-rich repeat (LRR) protein
MMQASSYDTGRPGMSLKRPFYKKRWVWMLTAILIVGVSVIVMVGTAGGDTSSPSRGMVLPQSDLPPEEVSNNKNELGSVLVSIYDRLGLSWKSFADQNSPQTMALTWVAGSDVYANMDRSQRIQRYTLGVFYYSTYSQMHIFITEAPGWTSASRWMSQENECTWEGILCNSNSKVSGILLPEHSLTGTLPMELALLRDNLVTLDLARNYIAVEGERLNVFGYLYKLANLIFDDNYMSTTTGLPSSFSQLLALEKLTLSYNLLQGQIDGSVIASMQALTHLEIESNYLSGSLPVQVGQLPNLTYLYARRNNFDMNLDDIMAPGNLQSMFALWLDSNTIKGPLPTTIGLLTDLTSLSITSSTLKGRLPTEMAQLTELRRLWLYDNNLSGSIPAEFAALTNLEVFEVYENQVVGEMPGAICQAIKAAEYEYKVLTADCAEVQCGGCCTKCY